MSIPAIIKIIPPITEIIFMNGRSFLDVDRKMFKEKDAAKNGTARPIAYTNNSTPPSLALCIVEAINNIEASIGPIHGVHAAANTIPTKTEPINPAGLFFKLKFASEDKKDKNFILLNAPSINNPIRIIKMPDTLMSHIECSRLPTALENTPSRTNTSVKPRINIKECLIAVNFNRVVLDAVSSSTDMPDT